MLIEFYLANGDNAFQPDYVMDKDGLLIPNFDVKTFGKSTTIILQHEHHHLSDAQLQVIVYLCTLVDNAQFHFTTE
jgi:hypothetical protein